MATSVIFTNAWHPAWTPTIAGGWVIVPGGWSISVEFAFYVLFPLFAAFVTNLRRAWLVFAASIVGGAATNLAALNMLSSTYDATSISNFLFFWFPNQGHVFALGGILFWSARRWSGYRQAIGQHSTALDLLSIGAFSILTYLTLGHYLGDRPYIPAGLAVCLPLSGFIIALSCNTPIIVNKVVGAIGKVSFSAYLLHYAVLRLFMAFPSALHTRETSGNAVVAYGLGFALTVVLTYSGAWWSYRLIESPMVAIGKRLAVRVASSLDTP